MQVNGVRREGGARGPSRCCAIGFVVMASALAGCSASSDPGGGGAVTPASYPEAVLQAMCANRARCRIGNSREEWNRALYANGDARPCQAPLLLAELRSVARAVEAGRVRFNAAEARACLERLATTCLPDTLATPAWLCPGVYAGTVELGGACAHSEECAGGMWCEGASSAFCGACRPVRAPGAVCSASGDEQCARPPGVGWARCQQDGMGLLRCRQLRLAPAAEVGAPCGVQGPDGAVVTPCAAGQQCTVTGPVRTCRAPLAEGAPCRDRRDACVDGAMCLGPDGARVCTRLTVRDRAGEPCELLGAAQCNWTRQLACHNGACRQVSDGQPGAPCAVSLLDTTGEPVTVYVDCQAGLFCDGTRCVALLPLRAPCDNHDQCETGFCERPPGGRGVCAAHRC